MAQTAGAAGQERRDAGNRFLTQHKTADALRSQKCLVTGETKGVHLHFFHIKGKDACRLRRIQDKEKTVFLAECADCFGGEEAAADIAGVKHHNRLCARL